MMLLRVYVVPEGARSQQAVEAALALQREQSRHLLVEVIDVTRSPDIAKRDGVFTFPASMLFSLGEGAAAVVDIAEVRSEPHDARRRPSEATAKAAQAG